MGPCFLGTLLTEEFVLSHRNSPDECSVTKGGKMVGSPDTVGMSYGSYMEEKHMPPPNMTTSERRVIVPAGQRSWSFTLVNKPSSGEDGPSLSPTNLCQAGTTWPPFQPGAALCSTPGTQRCVSLSHVLLLTPVRHLHHCLPLSGKSERFCQGTVGVNQGQFVGQRMPTTGHTPCQSGHRCA